MVDRLGNKLKIGDKILYTSRHYKILLKGIIHNISNKRIRVHECDEDFNKKERISSGDLRVDELYLNKTLLKICSSEQIIKV